ncbi:MAG: alpha/beta hydrolase family protein, partial [Thermoanaerobaculia bacterium]
HVIVKSDRFKAAMAGASAALYTSNYGTDQYQQWWERELDFPWKNRALWDELSPFFSAEKVTTPTLFVGGEKDWNVPTLNSEQFYQALRRLGKPTELVVYPDENHSIDRPSFVRDRLERYLAWFDKWVLGEGEAAAGGAGLTTSGN